MPGVQSMLHLEELPLLYPPGTQTKQFSSHDPRGGNLDGSFVRAFAKYTQPAGAITEYVFFDESGPGCLYRQQMNVWEMGLVTRTGRIRFYLDDATSPFIDQRVDDFFSNTINNTSPLAYLDPNRFFADQYAPVCFAKHLKVVLVPDDDWTAMDLTWYQDTYLVYPQDQAVPTGAADLPTLQTIGQRWAALGSDPKQTTGSAAACPGGASPPCSAALASGLNQPRISLFSSSTAGAMQSIKLTLTSGARNVFDFGVFLDMYWDGEVTPSVSVPVGKFFGAGNYDGPNSSLPDTSGSTLTTLMYGFNGSNGTFYSYWPMPYGSSAQISLRNASGQAFNVSWTVTTSNMAYQAGTFGTFHAKETTYTQSAFSGPLPFAPALQETGRGHVVGLSFYSKNYVIDGDEFTFIDQSRTPQIHGDGTEDDHNQGWGGGGVETALWGSIIDGYAGAYRLYLNDSYVFFNGININYEYSLDDIGPNAPAETTDFVCYYYKASGPGILELSDTLDVGTSAAEVTSQTSHLYSNTAAKAVELRSAFAGYETDRSSDRFNDTGYEVTASHFKVAIDSNNHGVRLRKLLNRSGNGVQIASVKVDGALMPRPWSVVESGFTPASQGWMESDYDIPAAYTAGKTFITIDIALASASAGVLNEYKYSVFSFTSN
jgi:hypothetical protein